jgi:hypothetical protein
VLLADAASLFTNVWLFDTLPKAMGLIAPMVYNSDGDELVFHSVRFPLATGVTQKAIGAQLDTVKALHRESATFWNWLGTKPTKRKDKKADGVAFNSTMEDGTPILGNIELKGRFVTLTVNSAERAKAGTPLFTKALGNLVRAPLTEIQTIDQMRADHEGNDAPRSVVPPEIATKLVHEMLDKSYRETLDQPVGMLGDITLNVHASSVEVVQQRLDDDPLRASQPVEAPHQKGVALAQVVQARAPLGAVCDAAGLAVVDEYSRSAGRAQLGLLGGGVLLPLGHTGIADDVRHPSASCCSRARRSCSAASWS